jgi:hypothetical protein
MTDRQHRSVLVLFCVVGVLATAVALTSFHDLGKAYADVPTLPSDGWSEPAPAHAVAGPAITAVTVSDGGWELIEAYGPIWGGMLLGFGLASAFIKRNEKEHWLAEGRRLAIVTGIVGIAGALLQVKFGGGSWPGVLVTIIGAAKLVLSPTLKAS